MDWHSIPKVSPRQKLTFAVLAASVLSVLFPVAAPLFASFFIGVMMKEANLPRYRKFLDEVVLTGSSFFLGFVLGALLSFYMVTAPRVILIMFLGMVALLLSGIGGIIAGLISYKLSRGKINPLIGIAGVSCVPTTAKVAQKCALAVNKQAIILPFAMGPNVAGVITTAIISGIYVGLLR
jgi:Na+-transporting methylmalonyl-CoA/oxaloacetate decarboxylase beta subunit